MDAQLDPEVLQELAALSAGEVTPPAVGDVATRRANARRLADAVVASRPPVAGVEVRHYTLSIDNGGTLPLSWYYGADVTAPGSAVLYLHGGGMFMGLGELGGVYDLAVRHYVAASTVPMLVVDYRTAPEVGHVVPVEDCYAALRWLAGHAETLRVDPARLAVMGDSAGGGLAAGVALLARDRGGPAIAQQLLVYPMLDDRTSAPEPDPAPLRTWSYDDNATGWAALLGEAVGTDRVSPYAAPARATDLAGLPPAYLDVGELDIFLEEDLGFAQRLAAAGVTTEVHRYPGCPHAFDLMAPGAEVTRRAVANRVRRLRLL